VHLCFDLKSRFYLSGTASLELALSVAEYFELDAGVARRVAKQVGRVVALWRTMATAAGIKKTELDRMSSAFKHKDLDMALKGA
jgi:serine/threonine-protein kinase HipA